MGEDKATLAWGNRDLLGHAIARLHLRTPDVRILSGPTLRYLDRGLPVLVDSLPGIGAVAALVTALQALPPDGVAMLLAVDLPLVSGDLLGRLVEAIAGVDAAMPVSASGVEPFCAAYRASCLPAVDRALGRGDNRLIGFKDEVRVREIEAATLDPSRPDLFLNVNTPEDYERARDLARRRG
jgi:molybdopterin-guanine dinucleotide biosynthesis protein A